MKLGDEDYIASKAGLIKQSFSFGVYQYPEDIDSLVVIFSKKPQICLISAWAKPSRMLVLTTKVKMETEGEDIKGRLSEESCGSLDRNDIRIECIDDDEGNHYDWIYDIIPDFLRSCGEKGRTAVDVTGGLKPMSSAASISAFAENCCVMYMKSRYEGGEVVPGSQNLIVLNNPLDKFSLIRLRQIKKMFNEGRYSRAEKEAEELYYDTGKTDAEAELLMLLSSAYKSWTSFDFPRAAGKLSGLLDSDAASEYLPPEVLECIQKNCRIALDIGVINEKELQPDDALEKGARLVVSRFNSAASAFEQEDYGRCLMMLYSSLEKLFLLEMYSLFPGDLGSRHPVDFSKTGIDWENDEGIIRIGRMLMGSAFEPRQPTQSITHYLMGILRFKEELILHVYPNPKDIARRLMTLINDRNALPQEHGIVPKAPAKNTAGEHLRTAKELITHFLESVGLDIKEFTASFQVPRFNH